MKLFALHATDFYKTGHLKQYPEGTTTVYSNLTARSDRHADVLPDFDHKTVNFGLQGIAQWLLRDLWNSSFFERPLDEVLELTQRRMNKALGEGAVGIGHIIDLHRLGYLPVRIKALPEGTRVPVRVPLFTIENTHPDFYWVTNYLETMISSTFWKSLTTATTAYEYRRLMDQYAEETGGAAEFVPWQGHDFSFRGMSGLEDAAMSGAAHLTSFTGTDTILALDYLADYYQGDDDPLLGGSVPASEHAVMCMGGEDDEVATFRRLAMEVYPNGIVSIVSDTWDFWNVITNTAALLKDDIMSRDGKVVFRPDSGDPVKIIVGDPEAPDGSPSQKGAVQCLYELFGGTTNSKGYIQLDSHVGLIYGDSITLDRAQRILAGLKAKGFASSNIVFGIGSYTYQFVTRDTYGTAVKATYGVVNGVARMLQKAPKTDDGVKKSARGLLRVEYENGEYVLYEEQTREQEQQGELRLIYENSQVYNLDSISTIRNRLLNRKA